MLVTERDVCATRPEIGRRFPLYAVEGFLHDVSVNEFALIITRMARLTLLVRVKVIKLQYLEAMHFPVTAIVKGYDVSD